MTDVGVPDALTTDPRTVMVHSQNACAALTAVVRSGRLVVTACLAEAWPVRQTLDFEGLKRIWVGSPAQRHTAW